jgi:hypothetical protein
LDTPYAAGDMRHILMVDRKGKPTPSPTEQTGATSILERRRLGKVVHDERGNARVEWVDAPEGTERPTLSLEETQPAFKPERGYNPYEKNARALQGPREDPSARPAKRDLRKLSEWIKQMRELEERRRRGDDD